MAVAHHVIATLISVLYLLTKNVGEIDNRRICMLDEIKATLDRQGLDYQRWINEFGQVAALEARLHGKTFGLNDHVRGLLLAQLSSNRPWGPIASNLHRIDEVFLHYDPQSLKEADAGDLANQIMSINCGNRGIHKQMQGLRQNIETFEEIGTIDRFVTSQRPEVIAQQFASGRHKLIQIGFPLAMEYLRNVGINTVKPDVHICRMIGPERLALTDEIPSPEQAHAVLMAWAENSDHSAMYIDNLLWLFAAKDYGRICTAKPRCEICFVSKCNRQVFDQ